MITITLRNTVLVYFMAFAPSLVFYNILTTINKSSHLQNDAVVLPGLRISPFDHGIVNSQTNALFDSNKKTTNNWTATRSNMDMNTYQYSSNSSFAACLLIMDDNAILPEWLAYHYLRLPLRRLIVAIDPRSETSPIPILNRYSNRNLMNITIWDNDTQYMHPRHKIIRKKLIQRYKKENKTNIEDPKVYLHRDRQSYFITKCLATIKQERIYNWVIHLDTDEYILPNYSTKKPYKISSDDLKKKKKKNRRIEKPPPTIYEMLQFKRYVDENLGSACISIPRVRISTKESTTAEIEAEMPRQLRHFINASNLQTYRWRWRSKIKISPENGPPKAMLDVSRVSDESLRLEVLKHNPHRPVEKECLVRNMYLNPQKNSSFIIHHYANTWEQWSSRHYDARQTTQSNGRTWEAYQKLQLVAFRQTDHIQSWLQDFVHMYGVNMTLELLDGVGDAV